MKLQYFNGGINLITAPHLLGPNEGVSYSNIDNSAGHFKPIRNKKDVTEEYGVQDRVKAFGFYYEQEDEAYFTESAEDWVVFQEKLYHADRVGKPEKRVGPDEFHQLGIDKPTQAFTATPQGSATEGTVQYAFTFYNNSDDSESQPILGPEIDISDGGALLENLEVSTDPQVTHKRIYRVGGNLTLLSLVVQIDNSEETYLDTIADIDIDGRPLRSQTWSPAPEGLKYLTEAYAMLFGIVGSRLYFTPIAVPNAWPEANYLQLPNNGTGIAVTPIGLLVFTKYNTILITGTGPQSFAQQILTLDQGCKSHDSIVNIQGAAIWLSNDGICTSNGNEVIVISKQKLGKPDIKVVNAVTYNESYIVALGDKSCLVWDFAYGSIPKRWELEISSLVSALNILFGLYDGRLFQISPSEEAFAEARFKTGWLTFNDFVQEKVHDKYRIAYKGDVQVDFYVDGDLIHSSVLSSTKVDVEQVKIPVNYTRNAYIEFEIIGTGEVFEIDIMEFDGNE